MHAAPIENETACEPLERAGEPRLASPTPPRAAAEAAAEEAPRASSPIEQWRRRIKQQRAVRVGLTVTTVLVGVAGAVAGLVAAATQGGASAPKGRGR